MVAKYIENKGYFEFITADFSNVRNMTTKEELLLTPGNYLVLIEAF